MNLIQFFHSDKSFSLSKKSIFSNLLDIGKILGLIFLIFFPILILIQITYNIAGIKESDNLIFQFASNINPKIFFLLVGLVGPINEEIAFRLAMKNTKRNFCLGWGGFLLMVVNIIFNIGDNFLPFQKLIFLLGSLFLMVGILGVFYDKNKIKIGNFYNSKSNLIFWFLTLVFGILHIFNMENFSQIWFLAPILSLPQILLGYVLGYLRQTKGFFYNLFFHILRNSCLCSAMFVSQTEGIFQIFLIFILCFFVLLMLFGILDKIFVGKHRFS